MSKHNCGWMEKVNNLALTDFTKTLTFFLVFFAALESHAANYEFRAPLAGAIDSSSKILKMRIVLVPYHEKLIHIYERYEKDLADIAIEAIENTSTSDLSHPNFTEDLASKIRDEFNAFLEKYEGIGGIYALQFSELYLDEKDLLERQKLLYKALLPKDAKLKNFSIGMRENEAQSISKSLKKIQEDVNSGKTIFSCGERLKACDFSIAGEKVFNSKFVFYNGLLREAIFIITNSKENLSNNSKTREKSQKKYDSVASAFMENFGLPFGRERTTEMQDGNLVSFFSFYRRPELDKTINFWIFGDGEIMISLRNMRPTEKISEHIEISLLDREFFYQKERIEKNNEREQLELEKLEDLQRRKKDF
jgi:hypothetical protein